jgi:hypothetical protein
LLVEVGNCALRSYDLLYTGKFCSTLVSLIAISD